MIRKAETIKIKSNKTIAFAAGTFDKTTYKSCYLLMGGHFKTEMENPKRVMKSLIKNINRTIESSLPTDLFREQKIMLNDIPENYNKTGCGYVKLEYTFFNKRRTNKKEMTIIFNSIVNKVLKEHLENNENFTIKPAFKLF